MYFFTLLDLGTYVRYIVGKSTPYYALWYYKNFPLLEGMVSFLLLLLTQYSFSKYIERYRAIQILMSQFVCKMSSFVCVFICYISSCSPFPFLLVVDTSRILMISLTSLYTEEKQSSMYSVSVSTSWGVCRWSTDCWDYHPTALWTDHYLLSVGRS